MPLEETLTLHNVKILIMYNTDRIDACEGVVINKASTSKRILNKVFTFQPDVCNGCNDVLMMTINLNNIAILNI